MWSLFSYRIYQLSPNRTLCRGLYSNTQTQSNTQSQAACLPLHTPDLGLGPMVLRLISPTSICYPDIPSETISLTWSCFSQFEPHIGSSRSCFGKSIIHNFFSICSKSNPCPWFVDAREHPKCRCIVDREKLCRYDM